MYNRTWSSSEQGAGRESSSLVPGGVGNTALPRPLASAVGPAVRAAARVLTLVSVAIRWQVAHVRHLIKGHSGVAAPPAGRGGARPLEEGIRRHAGARAAQAGTGRSCRRRAAMGRSGRALSAERQGHEGKAREGKGAQQAALEGRHAGIQEEEGSLEGVGDRSPRGGAAARAAAVQRVAYKRLLEGESSLGDRGRGRYQKRCPVALGPGVARPPEKKCKIQREGQGREGQGRERKRNGEESREGRSGVERRGDRRVEKSAGERGGKERRWQELRDGRSCMVCKGKGPGTCQCVASWERSLF